MNFEKKKRIDCEPNFICKLEKKILRKRNFAKYLLLQCVVKRL